MTEKRVPTYDLQSIKKEFSTIGRLQATRAAVQGAFSLGYGREEIVATIQGMDRRHFVKSMTSFGDHTVWQDVYHVPSEAGMLYVKFTKGDAAEFKLLSFKGKDDD